VIFSPQNSRLLSAVLKRAQSVLVLLLALVSTLPTVQGQDTKSLSLTGVNLSARVVLQGPYDSQTGLMSARLGLLDLLPVDQPYASAPYNYSGTEQLSAAVSALDGQDAVVDWVLLELRDSVSPATIVAQQAVALQRDGDLVDPQSGAVVMNFASVTAGNYRVGVRHRNHPGVVTASALALGSAVTVVDFSSPAVQVNGRHSRLNTAGFSLLRAGDSNQDQRLIAVGTGNDSNPLLSGILLAGGNVGLNASYQLAGYLVTDFNLDGRAVYSGPGNDNNLLLMNILIHPDNTGFAANFIVSSGAE
jgi:hypothetical protein